MQIARDGAAGKRYSRSGSIASSPAGSSARGGKTSSIELTNVASARGEFAEEDVIFVALSLELALPDAELAGYAEDAGFDWTFAVMSNELLDALVETFGRSITSAPSTPLQCFPSPKPRRPKHCSTDFRNLWTKPSPSCVPRA